MHFPDADHQGNCFWKINFSFFPLSFKSAEGIGKNSIIQFDDYVSLIEIQNVQETHISNEVKERIKNKMYEKKERPRKKTTIFRWTTRVSHTPWLCNKLNIHTWISFNTHVLNDRYLAKIKWQRRTTFATILFHIYS